VSVAQVAESEHQLLTLARVLVGEGSFALCEPLLGRARVLPRLGPTALGLLRDTLARGVVLELGRRGGARRARHLAADGGVREGRLWERHPTPPRLAFSPHTPRILRAWLAPARATEAATFAATAPLTLADALVGHLALDQARTHAPATPATRALAADTALRAHPLVWLGFADVLATAGPPALADTAWDALLADPDAVLVLEALQPDLARLVAAAERDKRDVSTNERMIALGHAQDLVLAGFLAAADRAGRRDLAAFVVDAGVRLLARAQPPSAWIASLDGTGTLAERTAARRAAGAFLRAFARWHVWDEEHRAVRFVDDGYDAAQLLLTVYAPARTGAAAHARTVLAALDSLDHAAAPAAGSPTVP
jgi:hypothetical protein